MTHEDAERRIAAGLISQLGETLDELYETRSRLHVAIICASAAMMFAFVVGCGWLIALGQRDRAISKCGGARAVLLGYDCDGDGSPESEDRCSSQ